MPPTEAFSLPGPTSWPTVPGYEILSELGRGGMGVVYKARQVGLDRLVALKMILAGAHAGASAEARFRAEAEAVARLHHPNIVQVYEVGAQAGLPYFALEFCAGGSLASRLQGTPLPPGEAARLTETLARAVEAAHEAKIVHRDLKPANVLLAISNQQSAVSQHHGGATGPLTADRYLLTAIPKIADFGLAKKLDQEGQTQTGAVMGTPSYMAPEQAGGKTREIGPAADVYALGAILYELLTGRPPFKAATGVDTILQVLADEPVPVRQLQPRVPRDLETVCLKCLLKEPAKRYESALRLAEDLRRFQTGEPITARPVGPVERAWRWCRRNPVVAGLLAAVALTLVLGAAVASFFAIRANANAEQALLQKERADQKAEEARANEQRAREERLNSDLRLYLSDMRLAQRAWEDNLVDRVLELLEGQRPAQTGGVDLRGFEWRYWWRLCHPELTLKGHTGTITRIAFSRNGKRLASASADNTVKVWDTATGNEVLTLKGRLNVVMSPDGKRLASQPYGDEAVKPVQIWDIRAAGSEPRQPLELLTLKRISHKQVNHVVFSPDSQRLAAGISETVTVWDATTGRETLTLKGHTGVISSLAFSADGKRLASASFDDKTVKIWDTATGQDIFTLKGHTDAVHFVAFSPDGERLASGSQNGTVKVWDAATGQDTLTLKGHTDYVYSVVFSPDGRRVASAGNDKTVKVWDAATGQETLTLKDSAGHVIFSPDSRRLAAATYTGYGASGNGILKVWDLPTGQETFTLKTGAPWVALSPDGQRLASPSPDGTVKVWDATGTLSLKGHTGDVQSVAFSPDGQRLASAASGDAKTSGEVKIWEAATGREIFTHKGHTGGATSVAFSRDGKRLAAGSGDGTVKVWDAASGQESFNLQGYRHGLFGPATSVAFSPDGKHLAAGSSGDDNNPGEVKVWDAATGKETLNLKGRTNTVARIAFNSDGKLLASGKYDRTVKVWSFPALTSAGRHPPEPLTLQGESREIMSAAFSRDGKRLVVSSPDGTVTVWNAAIGDKILALTLKGNTALITSVAFSPNGKRLASGAGDGTVKLWEAATGQETLTLKHTGLVRCLAFSPDGKRLAAGSRDGTVKVWDATTGE